MYSPKQPMNSSTKPIVTGIIPVRGGSTGLHRKNLRLLAGKPLIWYTIQAALSAASLNCLVVSTEDDDIAGYVTSLNVEVLRHPPELSTDSSPTYPVIQWVLNRLKLSGRSPHICVVLRATSPLRTDKDIDAAVNLLVQDDSVDSVVSVGPAVGVHPVRLKQILPDGRLVDAFEPEGSYPRQRQSFEPLYLRNGAIYASRSPIIEGEGLWGPRCLAYVMPEERSININTQFQFKVAEFLIEERGEQSDS
jgi:CMP-N,N'-diacetyllegionaminic acid synthase